MMSHRGGVGNQVVVVSSMLIRKLLVEEMGNSDECLVGDDRVGIPR